MRCPFCQYPDSDVIDTRKLNSGESIRRRRKCASCGKRFTTYERVESVSLTVVKKNGEREPYDVDLDGVFDAARAHGKAVEINASAARLDLNDVHARRAAELGVPVAISTDTHWLANLDNLPLGLGVARRAWIGPAQVVNALPAADLLAWAHRGRPGVRA